MIENERMGGKVPAWVTPAKAEKLGQSSVETELSLALQPTSSPSENTHSYTASNASNTGQNHAFTFSDLLDMINPLQHVPLLSHGYREMTGDEIRPIGKIMGGALFGGPIGAVGGLIDTIVTTETGKDMATHITSGTFTNKTKALETQTNTIMALSDLKEDPFGSLNT